MKKLVLMAAAIVAVSFASCGNKAANADQAAATETEVTVEEVVAPADSAVVAEANDSLAVDSAAVVAE
ncbi:hypothetical protein [uncultured Bacteroides sp.]|uniref:hypothetical protein n=1 Tax=uncultured Bacteroides sp. TaxID=162156 RepID=UPI0023C2FCFC|nr:hypothetical protein [uncultured Bacteroides sp.]MDE6173528.1 hypothetical protein [Bacteroides sp.]